MNQIDTLSKTPTVKKATINKTVNQLTGNYLEMIITYRNIFPPGMLPSGVPSRVSVPELEKKFSNFFKVFTDYSWDVIITATTKYVEKYAEEDYKFMKNSAYFIYKEDKSGNKTYELASRCDMLDQEDLPQDQYYSIPTI